VPVHDRERDQQTATDPAAERGPAARAPAAVALQRKIGNRAFGQLVSRTPEESVDMLESALTSAHADVDQLSRTLLPYSYDQEGFEKVAEAYETKTETPLKGALEGRLEGEDLFAVNQRVPYGGFPPPKAGGAGGGG
jgi:hypothetical protein